MCVRRTVRLFGLLVALLVAYPDSLLAAGGWLDGAGCFVLDVYDPSLYPAEKRAGLSVTSSSLQGGGLDPASAIVQRLNEAFPQALAEELLDRGFFSSVKAMVGNDNVPGNYVIEAGVVGAIRRGRSGSVVFRGPDHMRIGGRLLGPVSAEPGGVRPLVADWECVGVSSGGWAFLGLELAPIAGNSDRAATNNVRYIAKALAMTLSDKDMGKDLAKKAADNAQDASQPALRGTTKVATRKWRTNASWDAGDFSDEIASFAASSERKNRRGVDGLWLTNSIYETHQKLLPLLDLSDALQRDWGPGGDERVQVKPGTMIDLEPLERFRGKDVYLVALTFSIALSESPLLWRANDVRRSLTLARADRPAVAVAAIDVVENPPAPYAVGLVDVRRGFGHLEPRCAAVHPVLVAFPTTLPDGSPLVRGVDDVLELSTVVEGRKVILTFNLGHLEVKSVNDLKFH
jgi:hypothetical protein